MKKIYQIASKALLLTLIFYIPSVLFAQNPNREGVEENGEIVYKKGDKLIYQWYININGGITQNYSDIQAGTSHFGQLQKESISPAFGLKIGKYISPVFGIHGSFLYGSLQGYNEDRQLSFETGPLLEGYLGGTVNFINLFWGYKPRLVDVYALLGIGLVNYTPEAFYHPAPFDFDNKVSYYDHLVTTNGQDFADGRAETGNTTSTIMPVGFGVDFRLSDRWDINFETALRLSDDDKLDGYVGSAPGVTNIMGNNCR